MNKLDKSEIKKIARKTILHEAHSIENLASYINDDFAAAVNHIFQCKGRVIITGIGKSAIIAQKIVATLNSTGTPAIFMHAADAIHGDLGIVLEDDVVLCISKSGSTPEIKVLVPLIKSRGNKLIAMVSNLDSSLARNADFVLRASIKNEACPNNLAPTTSTTAQLVIGDALAICLLNLRGFTTSDFAKVHPGGSLGKKLYLRVSDLYTNNLAPRVSVEENVRNTIIEISAKRLGATAVVDSSNNLLGIITDGDLRRMMEKNSTIDHLCASDIMTVSPKSVNPDEMAIKAFQIMEESNITQLPVLDDGKYCGIIHLHDIIKEGII